MSDQADTDDQSRERETSAMRKLGTQAGERAAGDTAPSGSVAGAAEDAYWRERYADQGYTDAELGYDHYRPAYRYGWEARRQHGARPFDAVEDRLKEGWDPTVRGMDWDEARPAVRDAFERPSAPGWTDPGNPLA